MNYNTNNYSSKGCCPSGECGTYFTIQGPVGPEVRRAHGANRVPEVSKAL